MQPKHFEHLANLERSVLKKQFQNVLKPPHPTLPFGAKATKLRKVGKQGAKPQVAAIHALPGDPKLPRPGKHPAAQHIRAKQGAEALVAQDGLLPTAGLDQRTALYGGRKRLKQKPRLI